MYYKSYALKILCINNLGVQTHTYIQTGRIGLANTDRQVAGKHTYTETHRQAGRQAYRQTHKHTHTHIHPSRAIVSLFGNYFQYFIFATFKTISVTMHN